MDRAQQINAVLVFADFPEEAFLLGVGPKRVGRPRKQANYRE
jgi:hypothetical protein